MTHSTYVHTLANDVFILQFVYMSKSPFFTLHDGRTRDRVFNFHLVFLLYFIRYSFRFLVFFYNTLLFALCKLLARKLRILILFFLLFRNETWKILREYLAATVTSEFHAECDELRIKDDRLLINFQLDFLCSMVVGPLLTLLLLYCSCKEHFHCCCYYVCDSIIVGGSALTEEISRPVLSCPY